MICRLLLISGLLVATMCPLASRAQVQDFGFEKRQLGTGDRLLCRQLATNTASSDDLTIAIAFDTAHEALVMGIERTTARPDIVFDVAGATVGDKVFFTLTQGEGFSTEITQTVTEVIDDGRWRQTALFDLPRSFFDRLVRIEGDIHFRLDGAEGSHGNVFPEDLLMPFETFFERCSL
ncbi:MAG: hypothetical protein JSV66_11415 [Trueperaceae bacterium]|nr:MAG: hypothetical protein JSV66_11415 [Trueperaceae bacterium]